MSRFPSDAAYSIMQLIVLHNHSSWDESYGILFYFHVRICKLDVKHVTIIKKIQIRE